MAGVVVVAPQRRAGGQHAACRVEEASALRAGHLRRNQGVWLRSLGFGQLGLALRRALSASQTMPQAAWSFGHAPGCLELRPASAMYRAWFRHGEVTASILARAALLRVL